MRPAFAIGNGRSRIGFDLRRLNVAGVTYGSNAVFRDFPVNYLVCCDKVMLKEATSNRIEKVSFLYTRARWLDENNDPSIQVVPDLPYLGPNKADKAEHWGSGHYSCLLACQNKHEIICHIGFDMWGNAHNEQNNVYSDTNGYKKKSADAVDPKFWVYHHAKLFEHYPETQFVFINNENWEPPKEWDKFSNWSKDTYQGLETFLLDYPM